MQHEVRREKPMETMQEAENPPRNPEQGCSEIYAGEAGRRRQEESDLALPRNKGQTKGKDGDELVAWEESRVKECCFDC